MFSIELYNNTAESNRLDKTDYLEDVVVLNGTLREGCSVIDPIVIIESGVNTVINRNYARISSFNRYYFIRNYTFLTTNLIQLELHVDVLMSFKDEIINLNGYLYRSGKKLYKNSDCIDPMVQFSSKVDINIDIIDVCPVPQPYGFEFKKFLKIQEGERNPTYMGGRVTTILQCIVNSTRAWALNGAMTSPRYRVCKVMSNTMEGVCQYESLGICYITGDEPNTFLSDVAKAISDGGENIYNFVSALYVLPIDLNAQYLNVDETLTNLGHFKENLPIGDNDTIKLNGDYTVYVMNLSDLDKPLTAFRYIYERKYNDFRDFNPYTRIILKIPFYGDYEIDPKKLIEFPYLFIIYTFNFSSLEGFCYIVLSKKSQVIYGSDREWEDNIDEYYREAILEVTLYSMLPLNSLNAGELNRQKTAQTVKMIGGILGSGAKALNSSSPIGAIGQSIGGSIDSITGYISESATTIANGQVERTTSASEYINESTGTPLIYILTQNTTTDPDSENFQLTNGFISNSFVTVSELENGGFNQYKQIHIENISATSNEKDEIEKILTTGFLY